ncbi:MULTISPECIES: tripartite tricarboxylate transporter substrate binding protein [unclassified Achromobacter]|uniref:Bug family tripartite tricarboxylate transporter substrate binding protein n=1 Tax=unclassified Achromobacter TaxID=2626865 RepID=UPI000B51936F|nr:MULTISPECIES: tripartite tricarboxylate transporter substrate-binding protein [unclassified Achromobacter]OWT77155.1 hypothetical protein CEY04_14335 [Achromobacter sp. HZ28]OWT78036.1 hypothetical protein CEY05_08830 [Achromobacter sp. HZ34]
MKVLRNLFALAAIGYGCTALAQYPDPPLTMVVPYSAGGAADVPTVAESGIAGYEMYEWNGIFLPAGTPPDVVSRLEKAVHEDVNDPATKQKLANLGAEPVGSSSRDFGEFVDREMKRSAEVLKQAGIQAG